MKKVQLVNRTTKLVTVNKNSEASVNESIPLPPKGKVTLGLTESEFTYIKTTYPTVNAVEIK